MHAYGQASRWVQPWPTRCIKMYHLCPGRWLSVLSESTNCSRCNAGSYQNSTGAQTTIDELVQSAASAPSFVLNSWGVSNGYDKVRSCALLLQLMQWIFCYLFVIAEDQENRSCVWHLFLQFSLLTCHRTIFILLVSIIYCLVQIPSGFHPFCLCIFDWTEFGP